MCTVGYIQKARHAYVSKGYVLSADFMCFPGPAGGNSWQ